MAELKKILVVHSDEMRLLDAAKTLQEAGLEVVTAKTAGDGMDAMLRHRSQFELEVAVDAVITGVYMTRGVPRDKDRGQHPWGLVVAAQAMRKQIPVVVCRTERGRPGMDEREWLHDFCAELPLPVVYPGSGDEDSPTEIWKCALSQLH